MAVILVFKKTEQGEREIGTRVLNLPVKLRSLLIAVDGMKSGDELAKAFSAFGDVPAMLAELEQKGCIERVQVARVLKEPTVPAVQVINKNAKMYMASYLYGILGPESDSIVSRIEKCSTNKDLAKMLDDCRDILVAMGKRKKAEEFWTMGKEMLQ